MAKTNIGRVSIVPAGEYSSLIEYKRLTAVSYQGNMYISRTECLGIEPTNEDYWFKAVDKGAKGDKGDKGDTGKDFSIYKTYPSISAMEADINNVPEGSFVMIASNVEDEDNSKLYVKSETNFVYITDMSGATGIQGPQGEKGDKPVKGVDYFTQQDIDSMVSEITDDANSVFNQNVTSKTEEFNTNATEKTSDFNNNYTEKLNNINNASTTAISNINSASTTAVGNVETAEDTAINNIETAEESAISDINTAKTNAIEEINSQDNVGRIDDLEIISAKNKKKIDLLLNNFENAEAEGTKIDLENTAEAPIEVVEIAGNTTQNGEPSLENEVEVVGVTGDVVNKFNNSNFLDESKFVEKTQFGIISKIENKKITYSGTCTGSEAVLVNSIPIELDIGEYYLNWFGVHKNPYFTLRKKDSTFLQNLVGSPTSNTKITIEEKNTYLIGLHGIAGQTYTSEDTAFTLMVSKINNATYMQYDEKLHQFSLGDKVLYGDENARDYFNITIDQDFYQKTGYRKITALNLVKKWKKEVLDGVNNRLTLTASSDYNKIFALSQKTNLQVPLNSTTISNIKCNYLKATSYSDLNNNAKEGIAIRNDKLICLACNLETITNLTSANEKLQELNTAGKPLYVVYPLATPETENITDEALIAKIENFINNSYTYKQATSINSDFYLKLNYRKNMYYDLESRVKALEQANTPSNTPE